MNAAQIKALAEQAGLTFFLNEDLDAGVADDAEVLRRLERVLLPPMSPAVFQMADEPEDVRGHVLAMRDFFLTLVTGYNTVGAYEAASDAQKMAVALNAFESNHNITGLSWPLEVIREEGNSPGLKTNYENDSPRYGEDL